MVSSFLILNYLAVFQCKEEAYADTNTFEPRVAILSDLVLLVLDPEKAEPGTYGTLVFWSNLDYLEQMKRNAKSPNVVTMFWTQDQKEVFYMNTKCSLWS